MRTRFTARLRPRVLEAIGFPDEADAIVLWYKDTARARIADMQEKIQAASDKSEAADGEPVEIDVCIDFVRRKRSLKANALMWALYDIICEALNREARTTKKITTEELHKSYMDTWAPKATFSVPAVWAEAIAYEIEYGDSPEYDGQRGRVIEKFRKGDEVYLTVWRTSSFWNTKEMADHIDRLLQDIADMGITRQRNGDLDKIFEDYEKWRKTA